MSLSISDHAENVQTAGTLISKDTIYSNDHFVRDVTDTDLTSSRSYYVYDDPDVQEVSRVIHGISSNLESGYLSMLTLSTDGLDQSLPKTISTYPNCTEIRAGGTIATISPSGLSFDSDDSAIFFGGNKEFKLVFEPTSPSRLLIQSYDSSTLSYTTRFSCLSS